MADLEIGMDIDCIDMLSEDQKIAFLRAFTRLAMADGHYDDNEQDFIKNIAVDFGVPQQRVEEVLHLGSDDELLEEVKKINNRRVALELIKEMCVLARADDVLSDEEMALIAKVGAAMGVEAAKIEQISNWVIDRLIWLEEAKIIFEEV